MAGEEVDTDVVIIGAGKSRLFHASTFWLLRGFVTRTASEIRTAATKVLFHPLITRIDPIPDTAQTTYTFSSQARPASSSPKASNPPASPSASSSDTARRTLPENGPCRCTGAASF